MAPVAPGPAFCPPAGLGPNQMFFGPSVAETRQSGGRRTWFFLASGVLKTSLGPSQAKDKTVVFRGLFLRLLWSPRLAAGTVVGAGAVGVFPIAELGAKNVFFHPALPSGDTISSAAPFCIPIPAVSDLLGGPLVFVGDGWFSPPPGALWAARMHVGGIRTAIGASSRRHRRWPPFFAHWGVRLVRGRSWQLFLPGRSGTPAPRFSIEYRSDHPESGLDCPAFFSKEMGPGLVPVGKNGRNTRSLVLGARPGVRNFRPYSISRPLQQSPRCRDPARCVSVGG